MPDGPHPDPCRRQTRRGQPHPPGSKYVGRPTRFGNPWTVANVGRATAVENYREALLAGRLDFTIADVQRELRGWDLICWCGPFDECHGDVLLLVAAGVCPQCSGSGEEPSTLWDAPICKPCGGTGVTGDA